MRKIICSFFVFVSVVSLTSAQELAFKGGHSHNDYHQARPLLEALDHGMVSIEADVFLREHQILVGHSEEELKQNRTLDGLYLGPLRNIIEREGEKFRPVILLVDIKDRGEETYQALKPLLAKYSRMLTEYRDGKIIKRQVTVILSGSRPIETLRTEKQRYAFIDGRLNGKDWKDSPSLIPLISDDWNSFFSWKGKGNIPGDEYQKLKGFVDTCHKNNQIIRFWGIPDAPGVREDYWSVLEKAGVDLLGCDCPACLEKFINKKSQEN